LISLDAEKGSEEEEKCGGQERDHRHEWHAVDGVVVGNLATNVSPV